MPADERGSALVTVILVSLVLIGLVTLTLAAGTQADRSSARDRNFDVALAVAEAGVDKGIAKLQATGGTYRGSFADATPNGAYTVTVSEMPGGMLVESRGTSGSSELARTRVVRRTMQPPSSFPLALFSYTSIALNNDDAVTGDAWANQSLTISQRTTVKGNATAATGSIQLQNNASVTGNVRSGGFDPSGHWSIDLLNGSNVTGNATASVATPGCDGQSQSEYEVPLAAGAHISGSLTTWGVRSGSGSVGGPYSPNVCTAAPAMLTFPPFTYNASNYDASTLHEFSSVGAFQSWLTAHQSDLHGTFYVADPAPSQANRIDLTGAVVTGDTTIITNAPVFTNGVTDSGSAQRFFVVADSYVPPAGSACDVNHDSSECAVHVKNNFSPSCVTATLIYADNGPVAIKNNSALCGAVYAQSILVKNNQTLTYDPRVSRMMGFGTSTLVATRWEERKPS